MQITLNLPDDLEEVLKVETYANRLSRRRVIAT